MRVMGLDVGQKTIGIALSDPDGRVAYSHRTIARAKLSSDLDEIERLVTAEGIDRIVIGLPLSLSGRVGPQAERVQRFAAILARRVPVPVEFWDERLTTVAAERAMRDAGASARSRKVNIDAVAAALILQGYLDYRANLERRSGAE